MVGSVSPTVIHKYLVMYGNNNMSYHRRLVHARKKARKTSLKGTKKASHSYIFIVNRKRLRYEVTEQYYNGKRVLRGVTKGRGTLAIRPRGLVRPRKKLAKGYRRPDKKELAKDISYASKGQFGKISK